MEAKPEMATSRTMVPLHTGPRVVERIPVSALPVHQLVEARTLHKRIPSRTRPEISGWTAGAAAALALLLAAEVAIALRGTVGPSLDEAIYLTAGRRVLEGHGLSDGYLTWFAGSLLWPAVAGVADGLAGLVGARIAAALLLVLGMAGTWRAAVALYGRRAGFFTAVVAAISGPVVALGHLAVIDAPAVAGVGVAFWAVTELTVRDDRRWLVLAALAFTLATLSKYPAVACGVPLVALIWLLRGRRAITDLTVFGLLAGAVLLTYFMAYRGEIVAFVGWRARNDPDFGATLPMLGALQLWYSGPALLLGAGGWLVCRRKALATVLLGAGLMFPAYHLIAGSDVGARKHAVFGLVFVLPLVGKLLSRLTRATAGSLLAIALLAGLAAHCVYEVRWIDATTFDVRPSAQYVAAHARAGDDFLIDSGWPFAWALYSNGRMATPWAVYDSYRIAHHQQPKALCRFDWFISAPGGARWSGQVRRAIRRCGTFRTVYRDRGPVRDFGAQLRFITWRDGVDVMRNASRQRR